MSVFRNDARSSIAFRHGDLLFELDVVPAVSFAFHHCRIPVINSIDVINQGTSPSRQFALILDIPGYALPLSLPVDALEPETATRIAPIPLELRYERLQGLEARRYAALTAAIDDYPVFRDEILVLGVYEWSLVASARKTLACYVQPGHAVVQQILADAHEMATGTGDDARTVAHQIRRLYETIRARYNLRYVREAPSYEMDAQSIRPPYRVIPNPQARAGAGTCIDLSLLFASCLESLQLQPLVLVIRSPDQCEYHALIGCWSEESERLEPLIESEQWLKDAVRRGRLALLEPTGVTPYAGHKLSFDDAVAAAGLRLMDGELVFALDVAAARHTVVPLEFPLSPGVLSILDESQTIARCEHSRTLAAQHMLKAAIRHPGARVAAFLSAEGLQIPDRSRHTAPAARDLSPPRATLNYRRCLDDARSIAGDCGAAFVEEEHLLYALLLSPSRSVDRALHDLARDKRRLVSAFQRWFLWTRDLVSTEHDCASGSWLSSQRDQRFPARKRRTRH